MERCSVEGDVVLIPVDIVPNTVPELRKQEPNRAIVGGTCLLCQETFRSNSYTTILSLGPGSDEDAQAECRAGRPYHGIGLVVHWACGTGRLDIDLVMPN
jgi:hypothetical protein